MTISSSELRTDIPQFEVDNTLTRSLKQQQAYALILQIGLWSGDKRRVEIAESCFQPVVTVSSRNRITSPFVYKANSREDAPASLALQTRSISHRSPYCG